MATSVEVVDCLGCISSGFVAHEGGAVHLLYGTGTGLRATGSETFTQESVDSTSGIQDQAETFDSFGFSLTAGDFDLNGASDLVIGAPTESTPDGSFAGVVHVLYGFPVGGLAISGNQYFSAGSFAEIVGHQFGSPLAAGDFNGDGYSDLAIGEPRGSVGTLFSFGRVYVLYGASGGMSDTGRQIWSQDSPDILDHAEAHDNFGRALAAGDFNDDGRHDLAVGVPREDFIGTTTGFRFITDAGAVNVIYGSRGGLTATGNQFLHRNSANVLLDKADDGDQFGNALSAWNFGNGNNSDLAIGVPFENVGGISGGAVNILYGSTSGLTTAGSQLWTQNSPGILDAAESLDEFGGALY